MEEKIIQIIPAPIKMVALFQDSSGRKYHRPIMLLALIHDDELDEDFVNPLCCGEAGYFDDPFRHDDFIKIVGAEIEGWPD